MLAAMKGIKNFMELLYVFEIAVYIHMKNKEWTEKRRLVNFSELEGEESGNRNLFIMVGVKAPRTEKVH